MATLQQYKCPCCDGAIEFDPSAGKLVCPFCDTEFEPENITSYADDVKAVGDDHMEWNTSAGTSWDEDEEMGLRVYLCNNCGGEVIGDLTLAATACPFCDSPVIMTGQLKGDLKPDYVIPFKVDKNAAKAALLRHCSGKKLLPKVFKDENHIDEIKGVYVPVWLFDAKASAAIRYKATKNTFWEDDDYVYTRTSFFSVYRGGSLGFERVPVDGSTKMDDALMESIEPYDFSEAVDFKTAYLSGFLADRYDVSAEDSIIRANERIKTSTEDAFASTVTGYDTVTSEASMVDFSDGVAKYALYPVWLLNTSWEGGKYTFAMNGQTGKFVGDLPLDKAAYRKWLFGIAGAVSAAAFLLACLFWLI